MKTNSKEFLERLGTFGLKGRSHKQIIFSERLLNKIETTETDLLVWKQPFRMKVKLFFKKLFKQNRDIETENCEAENRIAAQRQSDLSTEVEKVKQIQKQLAKNFKGNFLN